MGMSGDVGQAAVRCGARSETSQRQAQVAEVGVDRRDVAERGVVGK